MRICCLILNNDDLHFPPALWCYRSTVHLKIPLMICFELLHGPTMFAWRGRNFVECSIFNPTFISFEETSSYWSIQFVQFFSLFFIGHRRSANLVWFRCPSSRLQNNTRFHWPPSIGKPRIVRVSSVKTTRFADDLYGVCRVVVVVLRPR